MVDRLVHSEANTRRIKNVEDCFGSSGQALSHPGRVLVGEGVLTKICRKKAKPRQFFLFNDVLVYGNIIINKKKYNKQHILPLEEVRQLSLDDDGSLRNGWQIISPGKSFAVYAATPTEKAEWMAHINKCIQDLLTKTGKKPTKEHAAVWVPDNNAPVCMHCTKSKFNALNRRHHCRKCGLVVCGNCSAKKFLLAHISSKPLRVCNTCYEKLSSGAIKPNDPVVPAVALPPSHKVDSDSKDTLSRTESDSIAESGSSGEEASDDEDNTNTQSEDPVNNESTFYGEAKSDSKEKDSTAETAEEKSSNTSAGEAQSTVTSTTTAESGSNNVEMNNE